MKMQGATLFFFSFVAAHVASQEIKVECHAFYNGFPPENNTVWPSLLVDLKGKQVTVKGQVKLNISWAINIDASTKYLTGTRIEISGKTPYHCVYSPPFAQAGLNGSEKKWFNFSVKARCGTKDIQAANLPFPPPGTDHRFEVTTVKMVCPPPPVESPQVTTETVVTVPEPTPTPRGNNNATVAIFGGLAALIILTSCYLIYKRCGSNVATSLGFKQLSATRGVPVPVLIVYPAENSAFQRAVVALAEFLQWHGGCSVAVDMWQQEKIAASGPMRWLAEQSKAAERVLIVCPGAETSSHSPTNHSFPEASIPAAAHDLYPLILNMVASHAKAASELAKFWVVQLGKRGEKGSCILPLELRACRTFCLIKDLNKLCKSLRAQSGDDKKISDLLFRPGASYSEKSAMKLREALENLRGHQPSVSTEVQPLKCVVSTL